MMGVMDDLVTWLRATLNAIESDARSHLELRPESPDWPMLALAEVAAKRRILDEHAPESIGVCRTCAVEINDGYDLGNVEWPCLTVRLVALPYAGEPGYQEEWRPSPT